MMMALGYLIFLAFLSAIPFAGAVCLKYRPERTFAAGLLFNGLVYYFACALGLSVAGFYAILAGNLALYVPALLKLRKERAAIRAFLTPAVAVLYLTMTVGFALALREQLLWWDEFSHWASSAKLLFRCGGLNCKYPGLLGHASYPPGLPVLDILVHKCFIGVEFRDFLPRFAVRAAKISIFILPLGDVSGRKTFRDSLTGMLLMWLITSFLFFGGNFTCESDCILGVVFAAAVYVVMRHDRSCEDDLFLALLLALLFLIKKAGMGFAVMTQVLYVVRWIADRRSGEAPKRPVWSALVVLAAPFVMQLSWSLLLKIHHTPIVFPVGKISPGGIWRFLRYREPVYGWCVIGRFGKKLLEHLLYFAVVTGGLFWYCKAANNRPERYRDLKWFFSLTAAVFFVSLLLSYIFIFPEDRACVVASFRRYANGFLTMPLGVMLMLAISGGWGEKMRRIFTSYVVMALIVVDLGWHYYDEEKCGGRFTYKWCDEHADFDARYGGILRAPGVKFVAISNGGGGVYYQHFRYDYEDNFVDELLLGERVTPRMVKEFIRDRKAPYVVVVQRGEPLTRDYAELWDGPPNIEHRMSLYEVAPDGRLRSVR